MEDTPPSRIAYQRIRVWRAAKSAIPLANNYSSYIGPGLIGLALAWLGFEQVGPISVAGGIFWVFAGAVVSWLLFFIWQWFVEMPYEMHVEGIAKAKAAADQGEMIAAVRETNRIALERLELERKAHSQRSKALADARSDRGIEFEFSNECNEEHIESLFKRSRELLPSGRRMDGGLVSINEFFIGVRNPSSTKTVKNVRVMVRAVGGVGPTWPLDASLIADRTKADVVDIPPGMTDYFLLGSNMVDSREGMFHPLIVPYDFYLGQAAERDRRAHEGLVMAFFGGRSMPLLKNDGYKIELTAFGDDVPAIDAVFIVNARGRAAVLMA
jgi:hypothetical protein